MNWQALVDPSVSGRLCVMLLHSFWQVALLALVAWGLDRLWRRRSVDRSYATHVAALVAALVAMPVTYALVEVHRPVSVAQTDRLVETGSTALTATTFPENPTEVGQLTPPTGDGPPAASGNPPPVVAASGAENAFPSWLGVAPSIAALYAIGVLVMFVRVGVSIWRAHRLGATAQPIGDRALIDRLNSLAQKWSMRVVPVLARAEQIVAPKLVGLVQPTILLPASAITGLSPDEMEMILAHELAHVRRYDMWVNLLQRLAEAVLFFNPAVWYLSHRISTLREYCCDELTCRALSASDGEPRARYASALLRVVELGAQSVSAHVSSPTPAGSDLAALAASGRSPSELRRRVAHLFGEPLREPLRISRGGLLTLAIAAGLLLLGPAVWHSAADSAPPQSTDPGANDTEATDGETPGAPDKTQKNRAAEGEEEYNVPITVSGKATDGEGRPIAGATIYLAAERPGYRRLAETKTDEGGSYRFDNVSLPIQRADTNTGRDSGAFEVFGIAGGYALTWRPQKSFYPDRTTVFDTNPLRPKHEQRTGYGTEDPIELDLRFGTPTTIRGRIVDGGGEPIPETKLAIRYCDPWWSPKGDRQVSLFASLESLNEPAIVPPRIKTRVTDANGRFGFTGLPPDYRWSIDVRPPGHPPRRIWAVTREGVQEDANGNRVYSGDFEVVFAQPRTVKLRVVYDDTGEPAPKVGVGGMVTKAGFWETTNDDGCVETQLPDGRYKLGLSPQYGTPYLRTDAEIVVSADALKEPTTLRLRAAAVVDISVVDADSGEPLSGVDVWLDEKRPDANRSHRRVHGYRSWEVETRLSRHEQPRTDENGRVRVLFEPGKHRIGVGLETYQKGYAPVDANGKEIECRPGEPTEVEFRMQKIASATDRRNNGTSSEESSDRSNSDGGSDLLRRIRTAAEPILAEMAEEHGYGLDDDQAVRRVPPPFSPIRGLYYRVGHPTQSEAIPAGPSAMTFRWIDGRLQNWGMTFGGSEDGGYRLKGVLDVSIGLKSHRVEGADELLNKTLPGDWVVRPDADDDVVLRQLETILRTEMALPVRLRFREVERPVFVARGRYRISPLEGESADGVLHLTDETITTDRVHIFGKAFVPDSGAGGGTGEFRKFLEWLGRWIGTPIVDEVEQRPSRQISWYLHERAPSTDEMRQEDHDAKLVLRNISAQTNLQFSKENRPIRTLFVERED